MDRKDIEKLKEIEDRSKSNAKILDEHAKRIEDNHALALSIKEIAFEMKKMREDMNKIDKRVVAIEEKPNKRMDQIIGYILSAVICGLIGYTFAKLGLK